MRKIAKIDISGSMRVVAPYLDLGLRFAAAAVIFGLFGHWVDGKLHTSPVGLLIGVILGGTAGFVHICRTVMRLTEEEKGKIKKLDHKSV